MPYIVTYIGSDGVKDSSRTRSVLGAQLIALSYGSNAYRIANGFGVVVYEQSFGVIK